MATNYQGLTDAVQEFSRANNFALIELEQQSGWSIKFQRKIGGIVTFRLKNEGAKLWLTYSWDIYEAKTKMTHSVGVNAGLIDKSARELTIQLNGARDIVKSWDMKAMAAHRILPGPIDNGNYPVVDM